MAQVIQLGPRIGSHLALFCIHRVNWVNSRNDYMSHDVSIVNIILITKTSSYENLVYFDNTSRKYKKIATYNRLSICIAHRRERRRPAVKPAVPPLMRSRHGPGAAGHRPLPQPAHTGLGSNPTAGQTAPVRSRSPPP